MAWRGGIPPSTALRRVIRIAADAMGLRPSECSYVRRGIPPLPTELFPAPKVGSFREGKASKGRELSESSRAWSLASFYRIGMGTGWRSGGPFGRQHEPCRGAPGRQPPNDPPGRCPEKGPPDPPNGLIPALAGGPGVGRGGEVLDDTGSSPETRSARVTSSSTARRLARTAIQTSCRCSALPRIRSTPADWTGRWRSGPRRRGRCRRRSPRRPAGPASSRPWRRGGRGRCRRA